MAGVLHSLSEHNRGAEVRRLLAMVANAATAQSVTGVLLVVVASQVSKLSQTALQEASRPVSTLGIGYYVDKQ